MCVCTFECELDSSLLVLSLDHLVVLAVLQVLRQLLVFCLLCLLLRCLTLRGQEEGGNETRRDEGGGGERKGGAAEEGGAKEGKGWGQTEQLIAGEKRASERKRERGALRTL